MFNLFKKRKTPTDVTVVVESMAQLLIDDTGSSLPTPLKEFLDKEALDFSLESLKYVDSYLEQVRSALKDLDDNQYTKVILRCGSYCGEVIRKSSSEKFFWTTHENANKIMSSIKDFEETPLTYYLLFSEPSNFIFPMAKVGKYLENGSEDSLYVFALAVTNAPLE